MKVLILGKKDSLFVKSIKQVIDLLKVKNYISEHSFNKSAEIVDYVLKNEFTHVLMPNPYGNNKRYNCYLQLKKRNINVIASDRGALPGSWFFDSGFNFDSPSYKAAAWRKPLNHQEKSSVLEYINKLKSSDETLEKNGQRVGGDKLKQKMHIPKEKKIVFVSLQRPTDTVIQFFSDPVKSVENFIDWVCGVEKILNEKNDDYIFLLKKHPLENFYFPIKTESENIKYVHDDVHIYDLIEISDCVFLINSGVGVLSLAFGKKVVCAGQAFYAEKGLAHSAKTIDYAAKLIKDATTPNEERVIEFFHHLIHKVYSFGKFETRISEGPTGSIRETENIIFSKINILGVPYFSSESLDNASCLKNDKNKKILFVVPLAPLPIYRGNQARIDSFIKEALSKKELEVHLCVLNRSFSGKSSKKYETEIANYYGNKLKSVTVLKSVEFATKINERIYFLALKYYAKVFQKNHLENIINCPPKFCRAVNKIIASNNINNVFLNYAYTINSIDNGFDGQVILDTHDYQYNHLVSDQKINKSRLNVNSEIFKKNEIKLINKADVVIAINPKEAIAIKDFYKSPDNVITIPQFFEDKTNNSPKFWGAKYDASFIGSIAGFNVSGICWFIKNVMPLILSRLPDFKLAIAGDVCKHSEVKEIAENNENIELLGRVSSVDSIYFSSKIIVSPILGGAGMKIKNIEALSYGKSIVGTSISFDGIMEKSEADKDKSVYIADDPLEFANMVCDLSSNNDLRILTEKRAKLLFMNTYTSEAQKTNLDKIFKNLK